MQRDGLPASFFICPNSNLIGNEPTDHTHQGGPNRIRRHLSADEQARYLGHEANYRLRILT